MPSLPSCSSDSTVPYAGSDKDVNAGAGASEAEKDGTRRSRRSRHRAGFAEAFASTGTSLGHVGQDLVGLSEIDGTVGVERKTPDSASGGVHGSRVCMVSERPFIAIGDNAVQARRQLTVDCRVAEVVVADGLIGCSQGVDPETGAERFWYWTTTNLLLPRTEHLLVRARRRVAA